jgi:hypothetical protein
MTDPAIFRIPIGEVGGFGLAVVDYAAVGYEATWQAPGGKVLPTVMQADYNAGSTTWQCQLSSAALLSSPNVTTNERAGTFCSPPGQSTVVGEDTFSLDIGAFQDPHVAAGFSAFIYANRTKEVFWYLSAAGPDGAPRAIGRCRLVSGPFGGDTWTDLTMTISLPVTQAPDIEFGSGATTVIVLGAGTAPVVAGGTVAEQDENEERSGRRRKTADV